jgi:hypothetical protein
VSLRSKLRTIVCCAALQLGALSGVPMRPDEIQELMNTLAQPKLARTNPDRPDDGDLPPEADVSGVRIRRGWMLLRRPERSTAVTRQARRWWTRWRLF